MCDAQASGEAGEAASTDPTSKGIMFSADPASVPTLPRQGDGTGPIDFAALFPATACPTHGVPDHDDYRGCDRCEDAVLDSSFTPRTAALLHRVLEFAYYDIDHLVDEELTGKRSAGATDRLRAAFEGMLPPVMAASMTPALGRRLMRSLADLGGLIESGARPTPRCLADELLLLWALQEAQTLIDEEEQLPDPEGPGMYLHVCAEHARDLPHRPYDYDLDWVAALAFEDDDARGLYCAPAKRQPPEEMAHWFSAFWDDLPSAPLEGAPLPADADLAAQEQQQEAATSRFGRLTAAHAS